MLTKLVAVLATMLAAESTKATAVAAYAEVEELRRLDCIEDWMQLCSPFLGYGPTHSVRVVGDRVEVAYFIDETFVFKVEQRSGRALNLVLTCEQRTQECRGRGERARLETRPDGSATIDLPNLWRFATIDAPPNTMQRMGAVQRKSVELVPMDRMGVVRKDLERRYVPGGRCAGLGGYSAVGNRPCINRPDSSARSMPPPSGP